ncbi:hypothetical protein R3P38DRAFT_3292066 [Favolaschia claudopus]|uniref:Uncharacterized protein n=1 Tax=Favolaschia claudopus TaxID=2862362 RepID=A0AAV9ZL51_9AGAR
MITKAAKKSCSTTEYRRLTDALFRLPQLAHSTTGPHRQRRLFPRTRTPLPKSLETKQIEQHKYDAVAAVNHDLVLTRSDAMPIGREIHRQINVEPDHFVHAADACTPLHPSPRLLALRPPPTPTHHRTPHTSSPPPDANPTTSAAIRHRHPQHLLHSSSFRTRTPVSPPHLAPTLRHVKAPEMRTNEFKAPTALPPLIAIALHATLLSIIRPPSNLVARQPTFLPHPTTHPFYVFRLSISPSKSSSHRHACVSITRTPSPLRRPQVLFPFPRAPPSYLKSIQIQIKFTIAATSTRQLAVRAEERLHRIHLTALAHDPTPLSPAFLHSTSSQSAIRPASILLQSTSTTHSTSPVNFNSPSKSLSHRRPATTPLPRFAVDFDFALPPRLARHPPVRRLGREAAESASTYNPARADGEGGGATCETRRVESVDHNIYLQPAVYRTTPQQQHFLFADLGYRHEPFQHPAHSRGQCEYDHDINDNFDRQGWSCNVFELAWSDMHVES